jgi:hypothetical protein
MSFNPDPSRARKEAGQMRSIPKNLSAKKNQTIPLPKDWKDELMLRAYPGRN